LPPVLRPRPRGDHCRVGGAAQLLAVSEPRHWGRDNSLSCYGCRKPLFPYTIGIGQVSLVLVCHSSVPFWSRMTRLPSSCNWRLAPGWPNVPAFQYATELLLLYSTKFPSACMSACATGWPNVWEFHNAAPVSRRYRT